MTLMERAGEMHRRGIQRRRTLIMTGIMTTAAVVCFTVGMQFWGPTTLSHPRTSSMESINGNNAESWRRLKTETESRSHDWKDVCRMMREGNEKRVLVTGSAGFIGYHAAVALKGRGDGVIGLDNFNSYYPVKLKRDRASALEQIGVLTFEGDLTDQTLLQSVMDACEITHVIHLAAQAGVRYGKLNPMSYVESNVHGSVSLFEAARESKRPPAIVYASSSSVYGSNTKVPFSEEDAVDNPTSLYGATKRSVELTAIVYHRLFDLSLTGLRFFTVYGPMGRPDMASFLFARSIVTRQPIKIFTTLAGKELARDFTYIDDIVHGILSAMDTSAPSAIGQSNNRMFNIGNTHPVTVLEFVRSLERAMGQKAITEHVAIDKTGDVEFTHANVSKAHKTLGFTPAVSLDEGVKKFASWFLEYSKTMSQELWDYNNPHSAGTLPV